MSSTNNQPDSSKDRYEPRGLGGPGGTGPGAAASGFRYGMRALKHRDFRIFMLGAMASNSGNWLQNLTVPYVLYELTGRPLWVGLAGFAQFIPSFLLGPFGGALADRFDRRLILLASQIGMAITALLMWLAWVSDWHDPYLILFLTAITGVWGGLMIPSWQAFVPALVPREDLPSAITLNSTQFNAARAFGPAVAGVILATSGPSLAFLLNAVSFVAVIGALLAIKSRPSPTPANSENSSLVSDIKAGVVYISKRTGILLSILCAMIVAFFGNPVTQFTVVFAEDVYHADATVLGLLAAAVGCGAVLMAPALSTWDSRVPRSKVVAVGLPFYATAVIAFGLAPTWQLGLVALLGVGGGFLAVIATTNTAVQMIVADEMRGRVMSLRVMGFTLAFPLGSLAQGISADMWGPQATVVAAGGSLMIVALFIVSRPGLLRHLDAVDDTPDRE